jgi:hypothetical protein
MPDTPPRIPGYELSAPAEADVLRALQRHFGPERAAAIWAGAVHAAGLGPADAPYSPEALARVADVLRQQDGVARVIGRSLAIRIATYLVLRRRTTVRPTDVARSVSPLLSDPVSA